jgi:hypothetical protein
MYGRSATIKNIWIIMCPYTSAISPTNPSEIDAFRVLSTETKTIMGKQ